MARKCLTQDCESTTSQLHTLVRVIADDERSAYKAAPWPALARELGHVCDACMASGAWDDDFAQGFAEVLD